MKIKANGGDKKVHKKGRLHTKIGVLLSLIIGQQVVLCARR